MHLFNVSARGLFSALCLHYRRFAATASGPHSGAGGFSARCSGVILRPLLQRPPSDGPLGSLLLKRAITSPAIYGSVPACLAQGDYNAPRSQGGLAVHFTLFFCRASFSRGRLNLALSFAGALLTACLRPSPRRARCPPALPALSLGDFSALL